MIALMKLHAKTNCQICDQLYLFLYESEIENGYASRNENFLSKETKMSSPGFSTFSSFFKNRRLR